jgi:hypothetical protein
LLENEILREKDHNMLSSSCSIDFCLKLQQKRRCKYSLSTKEGREFKSCVEDTKR